MAEIFKPTNNIKGFWSHFKSQIRKENGVKKKIWITANRVVIQKKIFGKCG